MTPPREMTVSPAEIWGFSRFQCRAAFVICARTHTSRLFPGSSVVEQPAVNRLVAGSNPARGANKIKALFASSIQGFPVWYVRGTATGRLKNAAFLFFCLRCREHCRSGVLDREHSVTL